jgi:hypothetical protein
LKRNTINTPGNFNQADLVAPQIGDRVFVAVIKQHGHLRYLGEIQGKPGAWAGIELENIGGGKNDGSVNGYDYLTSVCSVTTNTCHSLLDSSTLLVPKTLEYSFPLQRFSGTGRVNGQVECPHSEVAL